MKDLKTGGGNKLSESDEISFDDNGNQRVSWHINHNAKNFWDFIYSKSNQYSLVKNAYTRLKTQMKQKHPEVIERFEARKRLYKKIQDSKK